MGTATVLKKESALNTGKYEAVEIDEGLGVGFDEEAEEEEEEEEEAAVEGGKKAERREDDVVEEGEAMDCGDAGGEKEAGESTSNGVAGDSQDDACPVYRSLAPEQAAEDVAVGERTPEAADPEAAKGEAAHKPSALFGNTFARRSKAERPADAGAGSDAQSDEKDADVGSSAIPQPVEESLQDLEAAQKEEQAAKRQEERRAEVSELVDAEAEDSEAEAARSDDRSDGSEAMESENESGFVVADGEEEEEPEEDADGGSSGVADELSDAQAAKKEAKAARKAARKAAKKAAKKAQKTAKGVGAAGRATGGLESYADEDMESLDSFIADSDEVC